MLGRIKEARRGIAARRLPARDRGPGRLVEPSVDLGAEAKTGELALQVATLFLIKSNLIFSFLRCRVDNGRRIGGCQQVAVSRA